MPGLPITGSADGAGWSVRVGTSRLMQTNVTVLRSGGEALVVDAPYFPDELAELPALAAGAAVRLFATHSHFDHLLARFAFPGVPLVIGIPTARALADDPARPPADLLAEDSRTYVHRDRPLAFGSLDAVHLPGWIGLGPYDLDLIEAAGHTADGAALWFGEARILCCGDYLSDVEIPLLSAAGSPAAYRTTLERLAPYLEGARLVVPGHGSACTGARALARLHEDVAYLDALAAGDADQSLPAGRDTPRQREIHRANLERHGSTAKKATAARRAKKR
jgi:glyoxylase-like metal-dependent hydrolase (beta-lactamase superfamily II)